MNTASADRQNLNLRPYVVAAIVMAVLAVQQALMGMPAIFILLKVLAVPMLFLSERGLNGRFPEARADRRGRVHPNREYIVGSAYLYAAFLTIIVIDERMTLLTACEGFALVFVLFAAIGLFRHWRTYGRRSA